jgi:hypothetical protein
VTSTSPRRATLIEGSLLGAIAAVFMLAAAVVVVVGPPFTWDEAVYALTSRHWLGDGPGTGWGPHRPPIISVLGMIPVALGFSQEAAFRSIGLAFGGGLIGATWFLARGLAGPLAGVGAALAVAAAPIVCIVLLGLGVPYWEWNGRYAIGGFVLGAALWGLVLRVPALRWPTAAIAVLTTSLAFVHLHDRPSGVRLLEPTDEASVWSQPDWSVQATDNPHLRALYRFAEKHVPADVSIAVEPEIWPGGTNIGGNLPPYPFFRSDLTRAVVLATSAEAARRKGAEWAVFRGDACEPGWRRAFRHGVWVVLRRAPGASCP